jgi:hypothetical protein
MNADPAYWAANVAPLDDATLLRFMDACEARRDKYQVALDAALNEARRRNLVPKEKAALAGGQSIGRKL